jgi:predicted DNA-binding helix-hairpin-helix protein
MGRIRHKLEEAGERRRGGDRKIRHATGQSTQVIVGADASTDADFLARSDELYGAYRMRRVYYSAFSPIPEPSRILPLKAPPLVREHRLYQADWLMRFYGFKTSEILTPELPNLDLELDPKLAWALRNRQDFPVDVQRASREILLRVPGLGVKNVDRILSIRRFTRIRQVDLIRLRVPLQKVQPFLMTADHNPAAYLLDSERLRARFVPKPQQLELFSPDEMR